MRSEDPAWNDEFDKVVEEEHMDGLVQFGKPGTTRSKPCS